MSDKTLYTIIVHSENIAGLLNQVTAVFTRRQINIESLNVSASSIKGVHKYTITAWTDKDTIEKVSTPAFQETPEASKLIRRYNARVVEVNPVFSIVEKNGMSEDITSLYGELKALNCVLQFVRSGRVAITTSCFERVNEFLDGREAMYNQSKNQQE